MKANRVTLITLGVSDPKRSRAYYEALGWVIEEDLGQTLFFDMKGSKFGCFSLEGLSKETGRSVDELKTGAMTLAQNFNSQDEVDAMFATRSPPVPRLSHSRSRPTGAGIRPTSRTRTDTFGSSRITRSGRWTTRAASFDTHSG